MHRDRNNNSWSELKAKRNHSEYDDAPLTDANVVQDDLIGAADSRKEKNDRATRQLDGVKNMFKDIADYANNQKKRSHKQT